MVLFAVIFVVVSVVLLLSVCIVSFEAFVAPLHQLQAEMLGHMGSEDWMAVLEGWHGTKFFFLLERAARIMDDKPVGRNYSMGLSMFMGRCSCVSARCSFHPSISTIRSWDDSVGVGSVKTQRESSDVFAIGAFGKS